MAIVEVKVPQLSESVAEATLMTWKKKPGDAVAMDEILIEVETDKVVLEVPAPAAGVMAELVEADGATVASEQVIARIDTDGVAAHRRSPGSGGKRAGSSAAPAAASRIGYRASSCGIDQQGRRGVPSRGQAHGRQRYGRRLGCRNGQRRSRHQG